MPQYNSGYDDPKSPGWDVQKAQPGGSALQSGSVARSVTADSALTAVDGKSGRVEANSGSALNFTIPQNSSVPFPNETRIELWNLGAGVVTIVAGGGVTLRGATGTVATNTRRQLLKRANDDWLLA